MKSILTVISTVRYFLLLGYLHIEFVLFFETSSYGVTLADLELAALLQLSELWG